MRTLLPTYNHANRAGAGCLDTDDTGLSGWGRAIVAALNDVGIVPDGSHCSARTGLDMCETSTGPVIYSHSCMKAIWGHPRNISDDQALACAATGGVIGITGVGIFLGPNTPTLEAMTRHLEYAIELVGGRRYQQRLLLRLRRFPRRTDPQPADVRRQLHALGVDPMDAARNLARPRRTPQPARLDRH